MSESTPKAPRERSARKFLIAAILVIIGWFAISGATGPLFGKLSTVQKNDTTSFLPGSAESTKAFEISTKFTAQDSSILPALVIFSGDGSANGVASVKQFAATVGGVPVPETTKTVVDYLAPNALAQLIPIPAQDGKGILLSIPLDNEKLSTPLSNNKPALPEVVAAIREHAATVPGFTESHVTGFGGILADLFDSFGTIDTKLLGITFGVVGLILIFVYRSPILWFIPLFCAVMALGFSGGLVYLLAKQGIIDLDGQSQGILSVLVIGAATDYALLLIARYREELHHYDDRVKAMKVAWRGVVEPIIASGLTVIAGLAVLTLSDLKNVRSLGPVAGIGILGAQMVMLTLLPAILVVMGRWIFWPKVPRHDDVDERMSGIWSKVAGLVGRHPRRTWLASGGVLLIAAGFAFSLNTGGLAQTESFTTKPDSVIGLEAMSKHFPAGSGDPTLVVVKQADMAKVAQAVTGTTGVSSVVPTMDPASVMAGKPAIKVVDGWTRLELTLDKPADSLEAQAYIPGIREVVHHASETALVGGTTPTSYDIQQTNKRDRDLIIPVALLVIGLILALLLRSIVAPILLIITTVLSFAATLGVCHLVFKNVFHFKATDGSFPLFAFVFLVALGIDYNIFLMTRVREEAKKIGTRPGILKGVTVTGGVITSAGVVLAATFAVLGTLPLVFLAELGFAVAFGVLLDTIVVRSLLVPALSYELDKKIWWPSKLAKVDGADA
jgi:RND superfamily putative drug exporter